MKEQFLAEDKVVIESVVPKLIAFKSLMTMRDIQFRKAEELAKVKEKKAKNEAFLKANPKRAKPEKKREASKSKSPGKSKSPSKGKEKSKSKSPGKKKKDEEEEEVVEEKDPLTMTEEEIYLKRMSGEEDLSMLTEDQRKHRLEEIERKKFGRYWIWSGYCNEKNTELWLQTVEALKHINVEVIEDIEDYILLEAFKGKSKSKIQQIMR